MAAMVLAATLATGSCTSNSNNTENNCPNGVCGESNDGNTTGASGSDGGSTDGKTGSGGTESEGEDATGGASGGESPAGGATSGTGSGGETGDDGDRSAASYDLKIPHDHYVDVDGKAITNQSGNADDVYFFSGYFSFSAPVQMGVIENANIPACSTLSERADETVDLRNVKTTQSLCIQTDEGQWVLATLLDAEEPPGGIGPGSSVTLRFKFL
ncbi:hypothetical protein E4N62_44990 [Streptomyces sp. MNU76]|uniref:hypothetical protein n=1 Tax=Streptomyces sp. MNU76 TaxID=2560026 RepID=UPI001E37ABF5|nr:hypothetical protein [Streptomyces sp. MNU76]MCC9711748.1 hypothetical protein [Streptomyces sp. MNU76]